MPLTLSQIVVPNDEPVSLDEMKRHLRVTIDNDDLLIFGMIQAAREHLEVVTRRQFLTATWVYALDAFPASNSIALPRPPLQSISLVEYLDSNNIRQVLTLDTDYGIDTLSEPGRLYLLPNKTWPVTYEVPSAVKITYVSGWSSAALVPSGLKQLIYLLVGHFYEHREAAVSGEGVQSIPFGVQMLLWNYRLVGMF